MLVQFRERKVLRRKLDRRVDAELNSGLEVQSHSLKLSQDVMLMAQTIATEWGLKTPRDAVEAVFRKYANEYMYGRQNSERQPDSMDLAMQGDGFKARRITQDAVQCEAMNELDGLLGM